MAREKLTELAAELKDISVVERPPKLEGRQMIMILAPTGQEAKPQAAAQPS